MGDSLLIGLTGLMGSGKGEVVNILEEMGFKAISLSDIVREEAKKAGGEVSRSQMQNIGNKLREDEGAGVLGKRIREKIKKSSISRWVIDGIRNPAEITALREMENFFLLGVESDRFFLLERLKNRGRTMDVSDESELIRRMDREWGKDEPDSGQHVGRCMALADFVVVNNDSLTELRRQVIDLLKKIEGNHET